MKTAITTNPFEAIEIKRREAVHEFVNYKVKKATNNVLDFARYLYIVLVLVLFVAAILEIKTMYNIDIFQGVDTPFDNVERSMKKTVNDLVEVDFFTNESNQQQA